MTHCDIYYIISQRQSEYERRQAVYLQICVDPDIDSVLAVRITLELEDTLGYKIDSEVCFEKIDDETDVLVTLGEVPGTYLGFDERVKAILEGLVPEERIRTKIIESPDEWE